VLAERQQPGEVGDVLLPDLGELLLAVVGLVRQPEAALHQVEQVAVGAPVVGVDVGAEQAVAADPLELAEERRQVAHVAQPVRRLDQGPDRAQAEGGHRLGVHERVVESGDLARVLVELARLPRGQLGDDVAHLLLGLVGQLHERAPGGAVGRDLRLRQPAAVHVAEEVVLRPDVQVHALAGFVEHAHPSEPRSCRGAAAHSPFHPACPHATLGGCVPPQQSSP
jgi:hypothetical protein